MESSLHQRVRNDHVQAEGMKMFMLVCIIVCVLVFDSLSLSASFFSSSFFLSIFPVCRNSSRISIPLFLSARSRRLVNMFSLMFYLCTGPWTAEEHSRFVEGLRLFGRGSWVTISKFIGTRTRVRAKKEERGREQEGELVIRSLLCIFDCLFRRSSIKRVHIS